MDRDAYSYIPSDSVEEENQSSQEFEENMRSVMIRVLVVSLAFYFGFMLMQKMTKLFRFFVPKRNPWKTEEKSSITADKGKIEQSGDEASTKKDTKDKKNK
jgi:hypothetical protein